MNKANRIKDIILGTMMISFSLYILLSESVIKGNSIFRESIVIARADFYIKFLAVLLIIISFIVFIKAFLPSKDSEENINSKKKNNFLAIFSFIGLAVYTAVLKRIGFFVDSFLLVTLLSFLIMIEEKSLDLKKKSVLIKGLLQSVVISLITVSVITFIFTNWLKVVLP